MARRPPRPAQPPLVAPVAAPSFVPFSPSSAHALRDADELELRFRFKAGDLTRLMGGRTNIKTFSEAVAKLLRRAARRAAREPRQPTRRERAEALWRGYLSHRREPPPRVPATRSVFDFVHPDFLPLEERRRQSHRVADARQDPPSVGPPRPDKGVVLPVNDAGPYVHTRRMNAWLPHSIRDVWSDLDPGRRADAGRGDGDVLAFLIFAGVTPDEWEALRHAMRVSIRESLRNLLVIGKAVGVALDPLDGRLAQRAVELLQRLSLVVEKDRDWPRGFQMALAQRERWAAGRGLHQFIVYLFDLVKEHFEPTLIDAGAKTAELARQVNALLTERYGPDAARCLGSDIAALHTQRSADAAKVLVHRIDSTIAVDSVDRAAPRHRSRKKRKNRTPRSAG